MMRRYLLFFLLSLCSLPSWALDNSVGKEVEVTGGSTIGTPLPPNCTGDKSLQWNGSWQCNALSLSGGTSPGDAYMFRRTGFTGQVILSYGKSITSLSRPQQFVNTRDYTLYVNGRSQGHPVTGIAGSTIGTIIELNRINLMFQTRSRSPRDEMRVVYRNSNNLRNIDGVLLADFDMVLKAP